MVVKLSDVQELFKKRIFNSRILNKEFPQHIALSTMPFESWIKKNNGDLKKAAEKHVEQIYDLIDWQIKQDLPILTINLTQPPEEYKSYLKDLLEKLINDNLIKDNQVRIFIVGKWYDLSPSIVDSIKETMNVTHDYDKFFLNLCVSYDGQDEIMSALKLLSRKIQAEKLQLDDINKEVIKDNLFTSYFLPPQLVIESGYKYSGMLLWDTQGSVIHFTQKHWLDFEKKDIEMGLQLFNESRRIEKKDSKEQENTS